MKTTSHIEYLAHCSILESALNARDIANSIGKPYSTLLRETNPYDCGAKLGVQTALEVMRITGDVRVLEYMARQLGYDIIPKANTNSDEDE